MPPAPKFQPRRRNPRAGALVLPAEGRAGRTPAWPLGKATAAERAVWASLWHTPQAAAWEALGWTRIVARYARVVLAAEDLDKTPMAEARQLEDRLGLTPKAMRAMLWTVEATEVEPVRLLHAVDDRWRDAAGGRED